MKKVLVILLGSAAMEVGAQVEPDSLGVAVDSTTAWPTVRSPASDTVSTVMTIPLTTTPRSTRVRSERDRTAAPAGDARDGRSSGKALHDGKEISLRRALDPKQRRYWAFQNKKGTRQHPGSPPGTVPPSR